MATQCWTADEAMPGVDISFSAAVPQLSWPAAEPALVLEFSDSLMPADWQPVLEPRAAFVRALINLPIPPLAQQRFYRLRRP